MNSLISFMLCVHVAALEDEETDAGSHEIPRNPTSTSFQIKWSGLFPFIVKLLYIAYIITFVWDGPELYSIKIQ